VTAWVAVPESSDIMGQVIYVVGGYRSGKLSVGTAEPDSTGKGQERT